MGAIAYGRKLVVFSVVAIGLACAGCQVQQVSSTQLQIHQARIDKNGLTPLEEEPELFVTCAPPTGWDKLTLKRSLLYLHQQWRTDNRHVGFGVAYIHTPLPMSAQAVVWFAKSQYAKIDNKQGEPKVLSQWTDSFGREWFEGEDDRYHVRGYAMTRGLSAWVVYSGYRVASKPTPQEIAVAEKAADSIAIVSERN